QTRGCRADVRISPSMNKQPTKTNTAMNLSSMKVLFAASFLAVSSLAHAEISLDDVDGAIESGSDYAAMMTECGRATERAQYNATSARVKTAVIELAVSSGIVAMDSFPRVFAGKIELRRMINEMVLDEAMKKGMSAVRKKCDEDEKRASRFALR